MVSLKWKTFFFSAPGPTTAVSYLSVKCVDVRKNHHKTKWLMPWGPNQCDKIRDIEEAIPREIEANDIVFSVHIPLPAMEMSPWFQFMLFILQLDIAFKLNNQISKCLPFFDLSGPRESAASGSLGTHFGNNKNAGNNYMKLFTADFHPS